jgi:hypothetical protein
MLAGGVSPRICTTVVSSALVQRVAGSCVLDDEGVRVTDPPITDASWSDLHDWSCLVSSYPIEEVAERREVLPLPHHYFFSEGSILPSPVTPSVPAPLLRRCRRHMDEWVLVQFPGDRSVFVDDGLLGRTNNKFVVQRGAHTFHLGDPRDYTPPLIQCMVVGTSQDHPMILVFTRRVA